ncbi:hypothetical protein [Plebeiibacterium sediminum]|uniref:Uncharacterized protein n=1 Tax=Plebeiibacterium sediminum TaxID=2992112 RepID=A0AAE3M630_9BACT|nr:hypothetical protein [Plebeiobacterium sediminum]MCW3787626.1 hypothetical protein [Plebeiobacterium sediminum]
MRKSILIIAIFAFAISCSKDDSIIDYDVTCLKGKRFISTNNSEPWTLVSSSGERYILPDTTWYYFNNENQLIETDQLISFGDRNIEDYKPTPVYKIGSFYCSYVDLISSYSIISNTLINFNDTEVKFPVPISSDTEINLNTMQILEFNDELLKVKFNTTTISSQIVQDTAYIRILKPLYN